MVQREIRQVCIISSYLFDIYIESVIVNVKNSGTYHHFDPFKIGGNVIPELRNASDIVLFSKSANRTVKSNNDGHNFVGILKIQRQYSHVN